MIIEYNFKEYLSYFVYVLIFLFFLPYNITYIKHFLKNKKYKNIKNKVKHFSKYKSIDKKYLDLLKNKNFRNNQNYNI